MEGLSRAGAAQILPTARQPIHDGDALCIQSSLYADERRSSGCASAATIKDEKGEEKTAPVLDKAMDSLKNVHTGDKVKITCQDTDKGDHEGVSAIKVEKA